MNSMLGDLHATAKRPAAAKQAKAAFSSSAYKPTSTRVDNMDTDMAFAAEMEDLPDIDDMDTGDDSAAAAAAAAAAADVTSPNGANVRGEVRCHFEQALEPVNLTSA